MQAEKVRSSCERYILSIFLLPFLIATGNASFLGTHMICLIIGLCRRKRRGSSRSRKSSRQSKYVPEMHRPTHEGVSHVSHNKGQKDAAAAVAAPAPPLALTVEEESSETITMVLPSPKPEDPKKRAELEKKEKEKADQVRCESEQLPFGMCAASYADTLGGKEEGRAGAKGEGEG